MLEIEIDGKKLTVADGATVMDAAHSIGTYIPHFCYHKKLSISANCRMCLVQVEKAPKPLPACATPVTDGMKVMTNSEQAVKAQKGVMEFLLINHPLDCPICDQGGECLLQDVSVGYGGTASRYNEPKRVVLNKHLGALISTDMTRCIHCTRCVRFSEEVAGTVELGIAHRGDRSEVMPFLERTVNSEVSANVIDLCPVGALTSKPFRNQARTWELSRRKSVSPHDGLGSNLIVQVKRDKVMRVVPFENEAINECWLSDRDRFSYEAINSTDRLTRPMIKQGGQWQETDWQTALEYAAHALKSVVQEEGADQVAAFASPHSTLEELYLFQKLARGVGIQSIDHRLRQGDCSVDAITTGALWLGQKITELADNKAVLIIGSLLRKEQPLLAQRLRQAVTKKWMSLNVLNVIDEDALVPVEGRLIVAPSALVNALSQVLKAAVSLKGASTKLDLSQVVVSPEAQKIAENLANAPSASVVLGALAQHHPRFGELLALTEALGTVLGASFGVLSEAANSVGAQIAGVLPVAGPLGRTVSQGAAAATVIRNPRKAYFLMNVEPELDSYHAAQALAALNQAKTVIALSAFRSEALMQYADVILPITPFAETSGSFVNMEGKLQSFHGVVKPQGEARPAWKVLRVLGNLLNLNGFDFNHSEEVRDELLPQGQESILSSLSNSVRLDAVDAAPVVSQGLERVGDVPLYELDALVRRAPSLHQTVDATSAASVGMCSKTAKRLGFENGARLTIKQAEGQATLVLSVDDHLPENCIRVPAALSEGVGLGGLFDTLNVECVG